MEIAIAGIGRPSSIGFLVRRLVRCLTCVGHLFGSLAFCKAIAMGIKGLGFDCRGFGFPGKPSLAFFFGLTFLLPFALLFSESILVFSDVDSFSRRLAGSRTRPLLG